MHSLLKVVQLIAAFFKSSIKVLENFLWYFQRLSTNFPLIYKNGTVALWKIEERVPAAWNLSEKEATFLVWSLSKTSAST